jgi:hypothetical protein
VVPFSQLSRLTSQALSQALSMGDEVVAVTVVFAEDKGRQAELEAAWKRWDPGVPLVVLQSPYRSVVRPLLRYIGSLKPPATSGTRPSTTTWNWSSPPRFGVATTWWWLG